MSSFDCKFLQIVWFYSSKDQYVAQSIYNDVFKEEPEIVQSNKSISQTTPFLSQAKGHVEGVDSIVTVFPGRVDIAIQAPQPQTDNQKAFPIFDIRTHFKFFENVVMSGMLFIKGCYRQATVCEFISEFGSREEASRALFEKCHIGGLAEDSIDLIHQFNVRKEFDDGFLLNRLIINSVEQMQLFQFPGTIPVNGPAFQFNPDQHVPTYESFAYSEKYDFNNYPSGKVFSKDEQVANVKLIFNEICRLREGGEL